VLALGIGANAVVFAVLKAAVLNQLPYPHPERLVAIVPSSGGAATPDDVESRTAHEWAVRARSFDALEAWGDAGARLTIAGRTEMVRGMRISAGYLDLLGAPMQLGRGFSADDRDAVILTDGVWHELFGGDPAIVGRTVPAVGPALRVVGVLSPEFHPLHMSNPGELPRIFIPLGYDLRRNPCRECQAVRVIARLGRGIPITRAQA